MLLSYSLINVAYFRIYGRFLSGIQLEVSLKHIIETIGTLRIQLEISMLDISKLKSIYVCDTTRRRFESPQG